MGPSVWLIAGPTASGKSALALRLAEAIGAELVNADSMQLYADLNVLTARPSPAEMARAPHHLYGVADAAEAWSVGRWLQAARRHLGRIAGLGRPAVVVGGTGLYFRALTLGLADIPAVPASTRDEVTGRYDSLGESAFRSRLAAHDPLSAQRIQPGDRQRLIRAASVLDATGRSLSAWREAGPAALQPGAYHAVVLDPARAALYARCDARLQVMAEAGALDEVAALLARSLPPDLPAMKALGVREFAAFLQGRCSLSEAVSQAQLQTRRYAKRQTTWFRNQTPDWARITAADQGTQWGALQALLERRQA